MNDLLDAYPRSVKIPEDLKSYVRVQGERAFGPEQIQITVNRKDIPHFVRWVSGYLAELTSHNQGRMGDQSREAQLHWANILVSLLDEPKITTTEDET